jgi:hypothetical protein
LLDTFNVIGVPLVSQLGPVFFVGLVGIEWTVVIFVNGFLTIFKIEFNALCGWRTATTHRFY